MRCPRCVETDLTTGAMDGLEACPICSGVSIDSAALMVACPSVAGLDRRALEIQLLGRRGGGIATCPRCGDVPFELDVLDVPIDWCARCGAIWIDGDEREALSVREVDPNAAARRIQSAYRADARSVERTPRCAECQEALSLPFSFATERGLVCRECHSRAELAKAAPATRAAGGWVAEVYAWLRKIALEQAKAMRR